MDKGYCHRPLADGRGAALHRSMANIAGCEHAGGYSFPDNKDAGLAARMREDGLPGTYPARLQDILPRRE